MPPGADDYDVVIGVEIADRTAPGAASVRGNVNKVTHDIRQYGDRQAREMAQNSRAMFAATDQGVTKSASNITRRLVHVFDTHNFLLRNMAFRAGSTTAAVAIGVGKLALSYNKLGKDVEDSSHRARVALQDLKLATNRLGTDPTALPAALKATRELSTAYEGMGKTAHAASVKAGSALETAVHARLVHLQGGLLKAQANFDKFRVTGSKSAEAIRGKINEVSASVSQLLGGVKIDAPFFKSFIKAKTEADKYKLVLDKLGPSAAVAYASNQSAVEKLATAFVRLESRSARSFKTQTEGMSAAATKVKNYQAEIIAAEKALAGATNATGAMTTATTGMTGAVAAGSVALGALLVVILLVVAAAAILTIGMYKGVTSAAKYGDEIYKLSLSTGLTVKTLSTLSIIAKETNTDVDSLAKTFTRTQIQIQRGLDKPFSEAGRALRTLKVDFQELRKANPDQQIITLAKAFTQLNNQNVRATVAQQLFSRDAERQAKMLEQVANGFDAAQKKAKRFGLELDESGAIKAHKATVAAIDMKLAWEGLWVSLGIKILPPLTSLLERFVDMIVASGGAFEFLGSVALAVLREIRIQVETISQMSWFELMIGAASPGTLVTQFLARRGSATATVDKQDREREAEYKIRIEELRRRGLQGDDMYAPGKDRSKRDPKSDLERLEERVRKLRFEIESLSGMKQLQLRFDLEELEKVKSGFESIFKLRNEMGLTLDEPVPQFRLFGSPEEQKQDLSNIQSYVKQMERMKSVFDGVRKVANEQADSMAELARVQQESLMPVVDAGTLAQIKYFTAIRERAKAEKELTADVLVEARLRKEAIEDEVGNTLKAYMTLQRDVGRSQDAIREQRQQDEMFVKIIRGDFETEANIRQNIEKRMGPTGTPPVPTELQTIAAHAATIDLNVASIAEKIGANVHNVTNSSINTPGTPQAFARSSLVRRNPDGTVSVSVESDSRDDVLTTDANSANYLRKKIFDESRQRASGERSATLRKANQDIIDNEMRLEQALIDIDTDYLDHYRAQQVSRREEARTTTISIMLLENDLKDLSIKNSELYKRSWEEADKSRLERHRALKEEIIQIENDIANNGFDQADRERKAYLQAIRDIQEASNQARESIIYNQVKIADATIYHAEIADAKVTEFLANQRSITEVIADAKIGVIDTTFSAIDRGLDKALDKLGFAKDLVKDLLSGFLRLALSPFFKALYGGQGGGQGGGQSGGTFGGIFGGGGNTGPGGTPPFAGAFSGGGGLLSMLGFGGGGDRVNTPSSSSSGGFPINPTPWGDIWAAAGGTTGKPSFMSQAKTGIASILPMLGMSLGQQAGGQSRLGQGLGMAGGLLAGGMGAVALLGTTTGIFAAGGSLAALAPLLTNPFTAVVAGALIIGAIIAGKQKQRREDEKTRNQSTIDTRDALWSILRQVQTDQMDGASARAQIEELHQRWIEVGNSLKDSKTRRHHMDTWNHFAPIIGYIEEAIAKQAGRENIRARMIPVFGGGGRASDDQLIKVRPGEGINYPGSNVIHTVFGQDKGYDTEYMYVPRGTRILNRQEMNSAAPMQTGGMAGSNPGSNDLPELHIDSMEISLDENGLANITIKSPNFKKAVIHAVKLAKKEKKIA